MNIFKKCAITSAMMLSVCATAQASVVYSYVGNGFADGKHVEASFTISDTTFDTVNFPNVASYSPYRIIYSDLQDWHFSDGFETINKGDVAVTLNSVDIGFSNGNVNDWSFSGLDSLDNEILTSGNYVGVALGILSGADVNSKFSIHALDPGVWSRVSDTVVVDPPLSSVPLPASLPLFASVLGLGGLAHRRQVKAKKLKL